MNDRLPTPRQIKITRLEGIIENAHLFRSITKDRVAKESYARIINTSQKEYKELQGFYYVSDGRGAVIT